MSRGMKPSRHEDEHSFWSLMKAMWRREPWSAVFLGLLTLYWATQLLIFPLYLFLRLPLRVWWR
jgi:hypothetical protein